MAKAAEEQSAPAHQPPVDRIRVESVFASIWQRDTGKGRFYAVSFERRYKAAAGEFKTTYCYDERDLPALAMAANLAYRRISELSEGVSEGDAANAGEP